MRVQETQIPGVLVFVPEGHQDERGRFVETFHEDWVGELPPGTAFVRDGQADNPRAGTLRGLHAQRGLGKLVRVAAGAVFDVIVDLRDGSPTWGQHVGLRLSAAAGEVLWVPADCAHGYITLVADTAVHYRFTGGYAPGEERGVRWDDPELDIAWPLQPALISDRDRGLPWLGELR